MSLHRPCICPLVVTRGNDQVSISSKFNFRDDPAVVMNTNTYQLFLPSQYVECNTNLCYKR